MVFGGLWRGMVFNSRVKMLNWQGKALNWRGEVLTSRAKSTARLPVKW